ncbi:carbohydrate porin [uncultured Enterovirga sp.]|uniref:carbohydrate porin n=1 Tax=uncultured Enterovirga sp. TaxID=2026352 RepID=UPI0035C96E16
MNWSTGWLGASLSLGGRWCATAIVVSVLQAGGALGQTATGPANDIGGAGAGGDPQTAVAEAEASSRPSADLTTSIQDALGPLGDPGGVRSFLKSGGIEYSATYIAETLGNARGGVRRGAVYTGRLDLQLDADLETLAGWKGATFHTNAYFIHGQGLSGRFVGNLLTVSSIEALPASRLYEIWFEQKLFADALSIRVGQLAADTEFLVSQTATLFVNSTFGWPNITGVNLPSGGPSYPLATPGIRAKFLPAKGLSLQVGLFNGDPAGPTSDVPDPQRRNCCGTDFRLRDPAFLIGEAAYAYNTEKGSPGEPGTVTLGGWHHLSRFDSQRFDADGLSRADPSSSGNAGRLRGNSGVYGIIDQTIYREADNQNNGASVFLRASASPSDRNLVDLYLDAGIAYKGLFEGRPNDTMGFGFGVSRISRAASALDRDVALFGGQPVPVRSGEAVLEATYQAVLAPGITLQPDLQYIIRPGGGVINPRDPYGRPIGNATVAGLRAIIRY